MLGRTGVLMGSPGPTEIPAETLSQTLLAQDVADALIALGWLVEPAGDDMDMWLVGAMILTDDELLAFAAPEDPVRATAIGTTPPLRSQLLAALRAIAGAGAGQWLKAYPSVMPLLLEMGLAEKRPTFGQRIPIGGLGS
jgi:hypothetical protein